VVKKFLLSSAALAARLLPASAKQAIYRSGPLASSIRRALNRAAPRGLSEVRVAAGLLEGCPLLLDLQTEKDFWLGTYEPDLQRALGELVHPGTTAFDVGANIGYITLMLARAVGPTGRVVAFEALPANVERLQKNLALNALEARVAVEPRAVAGGEGTVRFHVHASGGMGKAEGSASRWNQRYQSEIAVPSTSLDAFVYQRGGPVPQLIKMDIEGGEVLALPGMRRLLSEGRPTLLLEVHGPEGLSAGWDELSAAGYSICRMQQGFPRVAPKPENLESLLDEKGWKAYLVGFSE
jgi:FkbM family methyltransferase